MDNGLDENHKKIILPDGSFYFSRLMMLFSLFFLGSVMSLFGGIKIASLIYGFQLNPANIQDFINAPSHPDALIFIQNLSLILSFGLPAMVFMQFYAKGDMYLYMGIEKVKSRIFTYFLVIAGALCLLPLIDLLAELNLLIPGLETSAERKKSIQVMLDIFLSGTTVSDLALNILSVALLPAICEELFFRASLQNLIKDWTKKPHLAIIITAMIFSFIHGDLSGFIPRFVAGIILGLIYHFTKNIGLTILFHFIFNCFTVVITWLMNRGAMQIDENMSWPLYIAIPSTLFLAASVSMLYKINTKATDGIN